MSRAPRMLFRAASPILLLAACAGAADTPVAPAAPPLAVAVIDTVDGVVRVTNPGATAWADTSGWRFTLERTIDPAEGSPGEMSRIDALALDDAGYTYVMQRDPERILLFGPDGAFVRTIGRAGDGPGDVRQGYFATVGDTLVIQQPGNSRLARFRRDGTHLDAAKSVCCYGGTAIVRDTAGLFWVAGSMLVDGWPGWARFDHDLKRIDVVAMPTDTALPRTSKSWTTPITVNGNKGAAYIQVPLQPKVIHAPRGDGTFVWGRIDRSELVVSVPPGRAVRRIGFTLPVIPLSAEERDSIVRVATTAWPGGRMGIPNPDWSKVAGAKDLPAAWPPWRTLATDPAHRIWVGVPGARGALSRLLVFDPDGRLLGDVPPPHPRLFDGFWGRDHVAVPDEDAEGRPVIRIYRLVREARLTAP